jgi:hypothetical protein
MDYNNYYENEETLVETIERIEKYVLENDYKNAFILFLLSIEKLEPNDRDSLIIYFKNFTRKFSFLK